MKVLKKVLFGILGVLLVTVVIILIVRVFGRLYYSQTPKGGINESFYVDINGSKQWISIYGEDINNPVLLSLHGGPGASASICEYYIMRPWADKYTIVTWDQRNCGKSYSKDQNGTVKYTYDLFMEDGRQMTEFLRNYLGKDKITLFGHSWGTYLGTNLALKYPELYDCYIGAGQLIDTYENEKMFVETAKEWVKGDPEGEALLAKYDSENLNDEWYVAKEEIMRRYGYAATSVKPEYSMFAMVLFNPHYSLKDIYMFFDMARHPIEKYGNKDYSDFTSSPEFEKFSLLGRYDYKIPYYNINGDMDYQTNYVLAKQYFDDVNAPRKKFFLMKDMTHLLHGARPKEVSSIIHEIAAIERAK